MGNVILPRLPFAASFVVASAILMMPVAAQTLKTDIMGVSPGMTLEAVEAHLGVPCPRAGGYGETPVYRCEVDIHTTFSLYVTYASEPPIVKAVGLFFQTSQSKADVVAQVSEAYGVTGLPTTSGYQKESRNLDENFVFTFAAPQTHGYELQLSDNRLWRLDEDAAKARAKTQLPPPRF